MSEGLIAYHSGTRLHLGCPSSASALSPGAFHQLASVRIVLQGHQEQEVPIKLVLTWHLTVEGKC